MTEIVRVYTNINAVIMLAEKYLHLHIMHVFWDQSWRKSNRDKFLELSSAENVCGELIFIEKKCDELILS
jgi:hypothetical protein